MPTFFSRYLVLLLPASTLLISQLLLKIGLKDVGPLSFGRPGDFVRIIPLVLSRPILVAGLVLGFATTILWLIVLSRLPLSTVIPVYNGLFFVLLLISTPFVLHERVTLTQWLGAAVIVLGMALVSKGA